MLGEGRGAVEATGTANANAACCVMAVAVEVQLLLQRRNQVKGTIRTRYTAAVALVAKAGKAHDGLLAAGAPRNSFWSQRRRQCASSSRQ